MDFSEVSDVSSCEWPQIPTETIPPTVSDQNGSASSPPVTPKSERIPVALGFGSGSSDPTHDSDSSYSELDSEAEAFYSSLNHQLVSSGEGLGEKQMSYDELMKKFNQCEEELRITSLKLRDSEQEIEKLKGESEKKEYAVLVAEDLRVELEAEKARSLELEAEKVRARELERQVVDLEVKLSEAELKVENLEEEVKLSKNGSNKLESDMEKLKNMFCGREESFNLEKINLEYDIASLLEKQTFYKDRVVEVEAHSEILEGQIWQSDVEIKALKTNLASKNVHIDALNKAFDEHKVKYDMLKAEKDGVSAEVENLKAELGSKDIQIKQVGEQLGVHIDALNKALDEHKVKYDMLKAEKDGVNAEVENLKAERRSKDIQIKQMEEHKMKCNMVMAEKDGVRAQVQNLKAELRSKDIQIKQMEEQLNEMVCKQTELVSESRTAKNKVKEREKQAELLRNVISEVEEEKREAIRQLCFSLDHYKTGYTEVLQVLSSKKTSRIVV